MHRNLHTARLILFVGFLIACLQASSPAQEKPKPRQPMTAQTIYAAFRNAVVSIKTEKKSGTGFCVGKTLYTCFHVVEGCSQVSVGTTPVSRIIAYNKDKDFVLFVYPQATKSLIIGDSAQLQIGDPLYVIGNPQGLEHTLTEGILSGRRTTNGVEMLQLSAAVSPGSSGSPVFNKYGEVVGIVTSSVKEGQQLNFALAINDRMDWNDYGVPLSRLSDSTKPNDTQQKDGFDFTVINTLLSIGAELIPSKLAHSPDFSLLVEDIDNELPITREEVELWIKAELTRSAPTAKIMTRKEQDERFEKVPLSKNAPSVFRTWDEYTRQLYINITGLKTPPGLAFYYVEIQFDRGTLLWFGRSQTTVWKRMAYGYFGEKVDASDTIRDAVTKLVRKFADEWMVANKPIEQK